jgi:hypothetical protein
MKGHLDRSERELGDNWSIAKAFLIERDEASSRG